MQPTKELHKMWRRRSLSHYSWKESVLDLKWQPARNHHSLIDWTQLVQPRRLRVLSIRSKVRQRKMEKESGMLDTPPTNLEVGSTTLGSINSWQMTYCMHHVFPSPALTHQQDIQPAAPPRRCGSPVEGTPIALRACSSHRCPRNLPLGKSRLCSCVKVFLQLWKFVCWCSWEFFHGPNNPTDT